MLRMETYAKFPYLIEITHETYGTFRYANCTEDVVYDGNTYSAGYFLIDPPERKDNSIGDAKLSISAIDQEWIYKIRNTQERAHIKFLACIQYDTEMNVDYVEPIDVLEFDLTRASWDNNFMLTWDMTFDEGMAILIPCDKVTSQKVPASI